LPLITTNCAVLGVALLVITKNYNLGESIVYAASIGIGFGLALIIMAGLRERLEFSNLPKAFQGIPIALILAGILSLAFMGFTGII
jgi:electron transport complex protein RnfA